MHKVAEQHDLLKIPKKYLISSYFGKKILVNTEMAEFYLNLGLKITRIYEFIEFHSQKCFKTLANEIVNSRREADLDKSKTVIALTNKLTGNSLYSASILNKEKHRNITIYICSPFAGHLLLSGSLWCYCLVLSCYKYVPLFLLSNYLTTIRMEWRDAELSLQRHHQ